MFQPSNWVRLTSLAVLLLLVAAVIGFGFSIAGVEPAIVSPNAVNNESTSEASPTERETPHPETGTQNDQIFCDDPGSGFECEPGMPLRNGSTYTAPDSNETQERNETDDT
ncbi:hypothetical protein [Haloarcula sp. JP-L23]|uniref:hypothetical protein n=1 Tax=Haloarcula sp. JP-L23 TaxID=2716717 RepID=UPI00140F4947|nr:hypothetical protein G9465_14150 [Haloarcula sp. JP-L23]